MLSNRKDRGTAVVTGGTAGIGRAVVRELASRGWDVAVLARGQERLDDTVAEVRAQGRKALGISVDVADNDALDRAADQVEAELGPIDLWVNNAFTGAIAFFDELEPAEYERITMVTYLGFVNGTRSALKRMTPRDRGHVIQIGSALAFRGIPLQSAYCGAKHALNGFLDSVRAELVHDRSKVRVSSVHLPAINTPQFEQILNKTGRHGQPVAPIYQPEVAARAVRWSADHPKRREVWVGIPTVGTIWGGRLAPSLLDRYLGRTGYAGQQTDEPWPLDAPHYLYDPVEGDKGAHGAFDDRSHARSVQQPLSHHHGTVVAGALLVGLSAAAALRARTGSHR